MTKKTIPAIPAIPATGSSVAGNDHDAPDGYAYHVVRIRETGLGRTGGDVLVELTDSPARVVKFARHAWVERELSDRRVMLDGDDLLAGLLAEDRLRPELVDEWARRFVVGIIHAVHEYSDARIAFELECETQESTYQRTVRDSGLREHKRQGQLKRIAKEIRELEQRANLSADEHDELQSLKEQHRTGRIKYDDDYVKDWTLAEPAHRTGALDWSRVRDKAGRPDVLSRDAAKLEEILAKLTDRPIGHSMPMQDVARVLGWSDRTKERITRSVRDRLVELPDGVSFQKAGRQWQFVRSDGVAIREPGQAPAPVAIAKGDDDDDDF